LYRTVFKNFILSQVDKKNRKKSNEMMKNIQKVSQHYLLGVFMTMGILGVLNSLGLWAIGVKYPLFWGFLAALLTIVPYAGTFIGGFFPFVFALLTTSTIWQPALVVVLFFAVQFLDDYFIKPKVVGNRIDLNPFIAILALFLGGVIWGVPAFVLALPYMAILKIVLEHFEETESLATLFSSEVYDTPKVFQNKYSNKKYSLTNILDENEDKT
jgi:predicted PurR-regulated permease PerM